MEKQRETVFSKVELQKYLNPPKYVKRRDKNSI